MRRWRLQFSLRTALIMMLVAAVVLGVALNVALRWPYYVAAKALDATAGEKSYSAWSTVRSALINDPDFRKRAQTMGGDKSFTFNDVIGFPNGMLQVSIFAPEENGMVESWSLDINNENRIVARLDHYLLPIISWPDPRMEIVKPRPP